MSVWTEERLAQVSKLWAAGHSASEIASVMGTTRNAICGKVHRMGLSRGPAFRPNAPAPPRNTRFRPNHMTTLWNADYLKRAKDWYAEGMPVKLIAAKLGVFSASAVSNKLRAEGVRSRRAPPGGPAKPSSPSLPPRPRLAVMSGLYCVGRPLTALPARACRYPIAGQGADTLFCGEPGHPWCASHRAIVYRPADPKPVNRDARQGRAA